eukprot:TRINITY_DN69021_c0_g1_i1.p1 TRINITY_DN69021_c0_g1~~TRINITY_DN69021_c0_g1_i1.p1  ORF type:complete len:137 (+),score=31.75 TRINITY_DN69021_c0_g1_i1:55-465(+)
MISFDEALTMLQLKGAASCDGFGLFYIFNDILLLYCALRTFRAMQSIDREDDKQWLTFWLVYILFDLCCGFVNWIARWFIPFYDWLKLFFVVFIGIGGGARVTYQYLEPYLLDLDKVATRYGIRDPEKQPIAPGKS